MRKRLARLATIVVLATGLLPFTAGVVFAGTQSAGVCTSTMNRWLGYENAIGDTTNNDDRLWLCNVGSLGGDNLDIDHALPGGCNAIVDLGHWANCLSSLRVYIADATRALCVYDGFGFAGSYMKLSVQNGWAATDIRRNFTDFPGFSVDDVASFKWIVYNGSC